MEVNHQTVAFELGFFGINLNDYLVKKNKPFHLTEQGLGGGQSDGKIAPNLAWVAKHPFWGAWPWIGYTKSEDPWQNPAFMKYREQYYGLLSKWAQKGGGPNYRVDGIYVWSVGTWDVHGVHPVSSSAQGSFASEKIMQEIRVLNAIVNGIVPGARDTITRAATESGSSKRAATAAGSKP